MDGCSTPWTTTYIHSKGDKGIRIDSSRFHRAQSFPVRPRPLLSTVHSPRATVQHTARTRRVFVFSSTSLHAQRHLFDVGDDGERWYFLVDHHAVLREEDRRPSTTLFDSNIAPHPNKRELPKQGRNQFSMTGQAAIESVLWVTVTLTVLKTTLVANAVWDVVKSGRKAVKKVHSKILSAHTSPRPELPAASNSRNGEQAPPRTITTGSFLLRPRRSQSPGGGGGALGRVAPKFRY